MKIIKTREELQEIIKDEEIYPPQDSLSPLNKGKFYKCGCGESHEVSQMPIGGACRGRSIAHSGIGKGFILMCDTHVTLVVTEGIFNYTFRSIWSTPKNLIPF
jgi:hypothetical protein